MRFSSLLNSSRSLRTYLLSLKLLFRTKPKFTAGTRTQTKCQLSNIQLPCPKRARSLLSA